jgi:hypothetical protein
MAELSDFIQSKYDLFGPERYAMIPDILDMTDKVALLYKKRGDEIKANREKHIESIINLIKTTNIDEKLNKFNKFIDEHYPADSPIALQLKTFAEPILKNSSIADNAAIISYANKFFDRQLDRVYKKYGVFLPFGKPVGGIHIDPERTFKTIISPEVKEKWSSMIVPWLNDMTSDDRRALSQSIFWYSWHYDTYLNAATRNRPYSKPLLITYFLTDDFQGDYHAKDFQFNYGVTNPNCTSNTIINSPGMEFQWNRIIPANTSSIDMEKIIDAYIEMVKRNIKFMFTSFTKHPLELSEPMTVYRSIVIPKGTFNPNILGFTSTSISMDPALKVANRIIISGAPAISYETHELILMKITLPIGTRVIPIDICGLFVEHEILLVSQGKLHITKQSVDDIIHIHLSIHYYTCDFEITADSPTLHEFRLTNEHVFYGGRKKYAMRKSRKLKKSRNARSKRHTRK